LPLRRIEKKTIFGFAMALKTKNTLSYQTPYGQGAACAILLTSANTTRTLRGSI